MCGSPEWLEHVRPASSVERAAALVDSPLPGEGGRAESKKNRHKKYAATRVSPPPPLPAACATSWSARASARRRRVVNLCRCRRATPLSPARRRAACCRDYLLMKIG